MIMIATVLILVIVVLVRQIVIFINGAGNAPETRRNGPVARQTIHQIIIYQ